MGIYYIVRERASTMRLLARQTLRGLWGEALLVRMVAALIISAPATAIYIIAPNSFLMFLVSVYSIVISPAINLGLYMYFLRVFRQSSSGLNDLLEGPHYISKALSLWFLVSIRIFLWSLLFIIPGIIAALRYSQAFFIMADDPSKSVLQCIRESCIMMTGNKMRYFLLSLSFFGWDILASIPPYFALGFVLGTMDPFSMDIQTVRLASMHPLVFIASIGTILVAMYRMTAHACFFELANGNLRVSSGPDHMGVGSDGPIEVSYTESGMEPAEDEFPEAPGSSDDDSTSNF